MRRPLTLALLPLLLAAAASSQTRCPEVDLRVKVLKEDSRAVRNQTQVDLLSGTALFIRHGFTDETGNVQFSQLDPGHYRLRVTDPTIEENVSDIVTISCGENTAFAMITVRLKPDAAELEKQVRAKEAMISTLELNVPGNARKEFEKGADAMVEGNNEKAEKYLLRAIELYPKYAMAYNHLGVVYMQTGRPNEGRGAFEQAVALNDRYPSALLNLAKLRFQEKKIQEADTLLRKALAADPQNVEALALLANAEIVSGKLDQGVALAAKVHALPHGEMAVLHYVLAQALEAGNRAPEAIAQYTIFLQEAPQSRVAPRARVALARLKSQPVAHYR
jgi:tetratricopeptide (TPR) repeat protein